MRAISPNGGLFSVKKFLPWWTIAKPLTFRRASIHGNMPTALHGIVNNSSPVVRLLLQTFEFLLIGLLLAEDPFSLLSFTPHGILRSCRFRYGFTRFPINMISRPRRRRFLRFLHFVQRGTSGQKWFKRPLSPSDYNVGVGHILKVSFRMFGLAEEGWSGETLWKGADI